MGGEEEERRSLSKEALSEETLRWGRGEEGEGSLLITSGRVIWW